MSNEVRNSYEGSLRWVPASGSGNVYATASGASAHLMAYVRNLTIDSGREVLPISDRGIPTHLKRGALSPINVSFDVAYGITANYPQNYSAYGSGHSISGLIHAELKMTAPEDGSVQYIQVYGLALNSVNFAEGAPENTQKYQGMALAMNGPTGSGYLG